MRQSAKVARYARPRLEALEERAVPALVLFDIIPNDETWGITSQMTLSGEVIGLLEFEQQGPGSLTTTYSGQILTDIDAASLTISVLRDGTAATAANSGSWAPRENGLPGVEPANYGGQGDLFGLTGLAAVRDLVVSADTSSPVAMTEVGASAYTFPSTQRLRIEQGVADYNAAGLVSGRYNLAGQNRPNEAGDGFVVNFDGFYILYAPINLTLTATIGGLVDVVLNIQGEIWGFGYEILGPSGGGAGGDLTPAQAFLATLDSAVVPLTTITTSIGEDVVAQHTPADVTPAGRIDVTAPAYSRTPHEAVVGQLFTDLFAADF